LTREILASGGASALVRQDEPGARLLSDEERRASLDEFMRMRPVGDLWIFAYGSLVWNPALRIAERRVAQIRGWHRSFCLSMPVGRGRPDEPGLVLGLDRGGICNGVAYRIDEQDIASELPILWSREMLVGGYCPIWIDLLGEDAETFGMAIGFTIDRDHEHYAGALPQREKIRRLATAGGSWGSSADYLFRTIDGLRKQGIRDVEMERLGEMVATFTIAELDEANWHAASFEIPRLHQRVRFGAHSAGSSPVASRA
jgi:cation transport protein ChaC